MHTDFTRYVVVNPTYVATSAKTLLRQWHAYGPQVTEAINPAVDCHYLPPAAKHHRPLAGTKLYCLWWRHGCKQLAQGCTWQLSDRDSNHDLLIEVGRPNYSATEPHTVLAMLKVTAQCRLIMDAVNGIQFCPVLVVVFILYMDWDVNVCGFDV